MHRTVIIILCSVTFHFCSLQAFDLEDESQDQQIEEIEPCNTKCLNGGQCFLSSFCICPKGYSGRFCEILLDEQCGPFKSMETIEINCVFCICYNGLFTCETKPSGLCKNRSLLPLTRTQQIQHALSTIRRRFMNIEKFEPITRNNLTIDGRPIKQINGYRIHLNGSLSKSSEFITIISCLLMLFIDV